MESKIDFPGAASQIHPHVPSSAFTIPRHHPAPQTPAVRAAHRHSTHVCTRLTGHLACQQVCSTLTRRRASCTWSWTLVPAALDIYCSRTFAWYAWLCAVRSHGGARSHERRKSRLGEHDGRCRREHRTAFCAHVGPRFIDLHGGSMLYDVCGGQDFRIPGLVCDLGSSRSN